MSVYVAGWNDAIVNQTFFASNGSSMNVKKKGIMKLICSKEIEITLFEAAFWLLSLC